MKRLLIGLLLLITACSRDKDPEQHMSNTDTSLLKEDIQGLMNSTLIQTDNGVIDLTNRTKTEYNGEFRNTRPLDTKLTISHDFIDFGLVNGSQVVGYRLSVKNIGVDEALNLKISPDDNFLVGSDRCTGLSLKTDEVCSFRIMFTGKDKNNGEYTGKVSVFAEANSSVISNLQAQVGESKNIQLESLQGLDISFPDRGTEEIVRNLRIVNRGPGVAERVLVKTYSGEFKLLANGCEGASLAKNQYCTLSVSYDPKKNNTGRALHSKLTVIPQDYSHNSLEISLNTTLSPILLVKEEIKEQDKSTKEVSQKPEVLPEAPKLQAPILAYNTKQLEKLNKQAEKETKDNQKQVQNAEKLLQSELLKEQEAEAKRLANLKAQELAAQIAKDKQQAAEEAARLKEERLERERLAKEEAARKKQELLEKDRLTKEEAARLKEERLERERLAKEESARKKQEQISLQNQEKELKAKQLAEQKAAQELAKQQQAELEQQKKLAAQKEKEMLAQQKLAELARQKAEAEAARLKKEQELAVKKQLEQEKLAQEAKLKSEQAEQNKLQQEQSRLAKIKADEEQKAAQKQAELAKLAALQAEQAKQKAIEQEKYLQAQKLISEQKAQAEAKILAEKQAAEQLKAQQIAQAKSLAEKQAAEQLKAQQIAQAKILADKQAAERLEADQAAQKEAELKAQADAKLKAEQKLAEQHKQEDLARQKAEAEQLALNKKRQAEELVRIEEERSYQAKVEADRIAAEEKAAKEAEQYRLAQEEQIRQDQLKQQELEAEKIALEQAELAKKQADEQKAWVTYQQQVAYKEGSRTSSIPAATNTLTSAANVYKSQISSVKTAAPSVVVVSSNTPPATQAATGSQDSGSGEKTTLVPDANGTITTEGPGPLTKLEIQSSSPLEVSWFKGLTPYNLYQRIVPSSAQLMPIQVNPANLVEGRIVNQRSLVNISSSQPLINSDSTNLEREIKLEIKATGKFESCSFSGVFSYLKCIAGTVTLMVKDLIHADKNLEVGSGTLVSNDVSISKYAISQVSQYLIPTSSTLPNQALYKGELYFQAKLLENQSKMFKISGLNIFQVSNLNPGKDDAPWKLVVHNSELYFAALDQNGFAKLFKTNGNQITQLSNIFPQGNDYLTPAVVFNGELYLEGMNSDGYLKLFKTDGKTITQISDTNPSGSDAPSDFMVYNSELYFRSQNMSGLTKLFKLNGEGIFQVSDINHNQHDAPEFLQTYQGYLYFSSFMENVGNKLFRTNGQVVEQVLSINSGNDEPSDLLVYNNELYFVAMNKEGFRKLYKTNGVEAMQVSNIKVGGSDFALDYRNKKSYLTIYNNELYFVAKNSSNGFKIFKTNGQAISQVSNINEISPELNPTGSDFPFNLMVYSNELYFSAYGNTAGLKLFKLSSESTRGLR